MGDLSVHFSRSEFECHGFGRRGHPPHNTNVDLELVGRLELLRQLKGGRPLKVVSGHRCKWWNARVGGAGASQHLITRAADLVPGYCTESEARSVGFKGVGIDKNGWAVHVDTRARPARWFY